LCPTSQGEGRTGCLREQDGSDGGLGNWSDDPEVGPSCPSGLRAVIQVRELIGAEVADLDPCGFDPLRISSSLQEAYFLSISHDAVRSEVHILIDCRMMLWDIPAGNTGLLVARGVHVLEWTTWPVREARFQYTIFSWRPEVSSDGWKVSARFSHNGALTLAARSARFFLLEVPSLNSAPPDFGDSTDDEVRRGLANWDSGGDLVQASSVS